MTDPKVSEGAVSNEGRERGRKEHNTTTRLMLRFALLRPQGRTRERTHIHTGLSAIAGLSQGLSLSLSLQFFNITFFLPPESIGISFDGTMMRVVCACLESAAPVSAEQSRVHRPWGLRALGDPNLAQD